MRDEAGAVVDDVVPEWLALLDQGRGDAVSSQEAASETALARDTLVVLLAPGCGSGGGGDARSRAFRDRAGQSRVVEVVVREQDELDLVERDVQGMERGVERQERLGVRRPGVDQREWIALEQPDVDRTEVRHGELDLRDARRQRLLVGIDSAHPSWLA